MNEARSGRVKKLGVVLFVVALLATILGVFQLVENWRGKKKWETYKRQLIAQGEKLDLASFIPPPIPDDQNFAASPFFAEVLPGPVPTNWWDRWPLTIDAIRSRVKSEKGKQRQLTDMLAWQAALRAQNGQDTNNIVSSSADAAKELLAAMKVFDPGLQELRAASARPQSRYKIDYDLENPWGIRLPHLLVIKRVCVDLSLKASAELAVGNNQAAMENVRLLARITRSMDTELFLINYMVKAACLQLLVQPIWEGLALGKWSDADLAELQRMMAGFDFISDLATPLAAERAAGILTAEILLKQRKKAEFLNALLGQGDNKRTPFANLLASLVPRGWFHMEQHNYARLFQQYVWPGFDPTNTVLHPGVCERNQAELDKLLTGAKHPLLNHTFLVKHLLPAVGNAHRRAAQAQTAAHQATIACALERYRRRHGDYPAELAALAPEFMATVPHDVIGGKPMRYKTGKPFVLSSVGWDEKDNRSTPGQMLWDKRGDWVWTYPQ